MEGENICFKSKKSLKDGTMGLKNYRHKENNDNE